MRRRHLTTFAATVTAVSLLTGASAFAADPSLTTSAGSGEGVVSFTLGLNTLTDGERVIAAVVPTTDTGNQSASVATVDVDLDVVVAETLAIGRPWEVSVEMGDMTGAESGEVLAKTVANAFTISTSTAGLATLAAGVVDAAGLVIDPAPAGALFTAGGTVTTSDLLSPTFTPTFTLASCTTTCDIGAADHKIMGVATQDTDTRYSGAYVGSTTMTIDYSSITDTAVIEVFTGTLTATLFE